MHIVLDQHARPSLQGGLKVDKSVQYADRAVYLPWRPRQAHIDLLTMPP